MDDTFRCGNIEVYLFDRYIYSVFEMVESEKNSWGILDEMIS